MSAFRQVITKLQDGQREEALIGLEFALRLDPAFAPAVNLQQQLSSGAAEIDLSEIIDQLQAPTTEDIDELLVEAVEDFDQRNFIGAKEKVERVLIELPGQQDGRRLLTQIQEALKLEAQVGQFLTQAHEALDQDDPQEAANFVMMAQALDPHHPGITDALHTIQERGGVAAPVAPAAAPAPQPSPDQAASPPAAEQDFAVSFETIDESAPDLATAFAEPDTDQPAPADTMFAPSDSGGAFAAAESDFVPPETVVDQGSDDFYTADEASGSAPALDEGFAIPDVDAEAPAADWPQVGAAEVDVGPEPSGEESLFSVDGSDIADLFEEEAPAGAVAGDEQPMEEAAEASNLDELLGRGDLAREGGDLRGAIHLWSQIYLIDPTHAEVEQRIAEARAPLVEIDRRVGTMLFDAQDAALSGDVDRALSLVNQVLELQPTHVPAIELKERLEDSGDAPPAPLEPALPELEEDLFQEEPSKPDDIDLELPTPAETAAPPRKKGGRFIGWRTLVIGVGAIGIILVGVLLGNRLLSRDRVDDQGDAVNRVLMQSQELFAQGQTDEAILLLRDYLEDFSGSDLDRSRVSRRVEKYLEELAEPTPTPVPTSVSAAEEMLAQGLWLSAYGHTVTGLQSDPRDSSLLMLRDRVIEQEPRIPALHTALQRTDFSAAVSLAQELVRDHPQQPEFAQELRRSLFNAALRELRGYNLTAAENYLLRLAQLEPSDQEVLRVLRFVDKYKTRPVDPRLRIFIQSLSER